MHGKVKKSEIWSFIFVLSLLIGLIAFAPILLNIKLLNGIGYYNFEGSNVLDYPEGSVGIKTEVNIVHWQGDICLGTVSFHAISSGNITVHGITHIIYSIRTDNAYYADEDVIINPAAITWNEDFRISLFRNQEVSCRGSGVVNFSIDSLEQTGVINFYISYIQPINVRDIFYVWDLPLMWIFMFYIVLIFVVLSFVVKIYKSIKFDYLYTDEMRKYDEEFLNYLTQKKKEV